MSQGDHHSILIIVLAFHGSPSTQLRMAMTGPVRAVTVIMMLKIWMEFPDIHIMKHMKPTCLKGAVARCISACRGGQVRTRQRSRETCCP